jgi:1-acyl-sn-glycerol-3-phosphate acyltransferase
MRTLVTVVVTAIATLTLGSTVLIARLLGVRYRGDGIYERCMRAWARLVLGAAGVRLRVHGAENIPGESGAVYIMNHVSWFDVFAMALVVPRSTFVAKRELRRIPMFGIAADAVGIVFLDRDNRKSAFESYHTAARSVEEGRGIVVCPEGTRGVDYHLRPFKKGPFVLAIAAQAKVVPAVVYGQRHVMPKGSFRIRSGTIDVHVLPPIATAGLAYEDRGALMSTVWDRMAELLRREHGIASALPAPPADQQSA